MNPPKTFLNSSQLVNCTGRLIGPLNAVPIKAPVLVLTP